MFSDQQPSEIFKLENYTMRKAVLSDQARKRDGVRTISVYFKPKGTFVSSVYVFLTISNHTKHSSV